MDTNKIYKDDRLLFLNDVDFDTFDEVKTVPVIENWNWKIKGDGSGHLEAPNGSIHCQYDIMTGSIAYEPDSEPIITEGLTRDVVQDMGEKYAYDIMFTNDEKQQYDDHILCRNNTKKEYEKSIRKQITGLIQLEYKNNTWLAHVDTEGIEAISGIQVDNHVTSKEDGIKLFNRISEKFHVRPLPDPVGYMTLDNNVYSYIQREYKDQYENTKQAIDNNMLDGTGHGVKVVLETLNSTIRKDVKTYMPDGLNYGDLRFVSLNDDRKNAVNTFIKARISKTLTYEKKRSYEQETLDRTHTKFIEAGNNLKDSLDDSKQDTQEL